jgi:NADPH:quinone reductase-like Zn-dependent oxidoreductase
MAASGELTLLPVKTFPFSEAATAHILLAQGHPNGKLVHLPTQ